MANDFQESFVRSAISRGDGGDGRLPTPEVIGWKPVNVGEYEHHARLKLPKGELDYFASGACDMITLRENRASFNRLRLRPRFLRDVTTVDKTVTVLGERLASPICIAPTAEHRAAHDDGETATARAAAKAGVLMAVSSSATTCLEDVVAAGGPALKRWFQLSLSSRKTRSVLGQLVKRAIAAGYTAFVVSGDRPTLGLREPDVRNRYVLAPRLARSSVFSSTGARIGPLPDGTLDLGQPSDVAEPEESLNWSDIAWLRGISQGRKIVIKGVMTQEDAREAVKHGADAVWVSNHGGRQLDTLPATIEVLPEVVAAVGGRCEIFMDGGIRRGTDVVKALALGAKAVFVGRPVIWGLAYGGQDGVSDVLKLLNEELEQAMALSGCCRLEDIKPSMVAHRKSYFSKL
ncbi:unnamed protein product [Ascophyllum nodosum]